jgi:predicted ATPase
MACVSYTAVVLWSLGYLDQALRRSHEALALAQELAHPHSLAYALGNALSLYLRCREGQAVKERAEALVALSTEHKFPYWLAIGTIAQGWALAEQGQEEEGIAQLCQGLAAYWATGAEAGRPGHLALLAEAYGKAGQIEEGLSVLAEALATVDKTGERSYEAELYRLKGELLLAQEGSRLQAIGHRGKTEEAEEGLRLQAIDYRERTKEAEKCFWTAIEIARRQQAKSLELRATVSLARLWQQQGKKKQARQMLAEIYGWFTEGFDTADLKDAKALLAELDGSAKMPFNGKRRG